METVESGEPGEPGESGEEHLPAALVQACRAWGALHRCWFARQEAERLALLRLRRALGDVTEWPVDDVPALAQSALYVPNRGGVQEMFRATSRAFSEPPAVWPHALSHAAHPHLARCVHEHVQTRTHTAWTRTGGTDQ